MVVVVRKHVTRKPMLEDCLSQFQFQQVKLLGIVMNEYGEEDRKRMRKEKKSRA